MAGGRKLRGRRLQIERHVRSQVIAVGWLHSVRRVRPDAALEAELGARRRAVFRARRVPTAERRDRALLPRAARIGAGVVIVVVRVAVELVQPRHACARLVLDRRTLDEALWRARRAVAACAQRLVLALRPPGAALGTKRAKPLGGARLRLDLGLGRQDRVWQADAKHALSLGRLGSVHRRRVPDGADERQRPGSRLARARCAMLTFVLPFASSAGFGKSLMRASRTTRRCRKYALIVNDHDRKSFSKTAGLSKMSSQKRVRLRLVLVKTPKLE
ncbi:hypothetical protein FA09DRAFT_189735 [Tilletiopsis washingtonensis]|uniref:Uncharacterized protein n=1 Tax=Tilletiopsis washingtonensis TaxID=58919 RepID=A0A316ZJK8_9BASI|nr:hypothetical protein FA09DRAFT_189735 [Tilletiopsis washingtonensis]PWO00536.1 hypothetical protein FA09DRAFT_189735 [Tilletiopsis washingtonensis]